MSTQGNGRELLVQGRIVWTVGNLFEGRQKTDMNTKQIKIGKDGKPIVEYGFGLAIPKIDPRTGQNSEGYLKVWETLHAEALSIYPSGQLPPDFAMKFKDGDGVDNQGRPFADREGYAGHIILACTTTLPIKYFKWEGGQNIVINTGIKCGDYVNVQLLVKAHPSVGTWKAGLYLNPGSVQLVAPGKEIINTPSGDQVFGAVAPTYAGEIVADTAPTMPQATPMQPATPTMPQAPVAQPHYQVLPQQMQPQAPLEQPLQPAAPVNPTLSAIPQQGIAPSMPSQAAPVSPVSPSNIPPMP